MGLVVVNARCEQCGRSHTSRKLEGPYLCGRCMGQGNEATIANYWKAMGYNGPPPPFRRREVSAERVIERVESLERINAMRWAGMDWLAAYAEHVARFEGDDAWIDPKPSPPPPPPRPPRPSGSGPRIAQYPTGSYACCNVTDIERR